MQVCKGILFVVFSLFFVHMRQGVAIAEGKRRFPFMIAEKVQKGIGGGKAEQGGDLLDRGA